MYNDRVITTVLIDPWQQRIWKFRLPRNQMIFQNLIRADRLYECGFDIPSFMGRIHVWTNPDADTRFGWAIEIGKISGFKMDADPVWVTSGRHHDQDPNWRQWKEWMKEFNRRAVSKIEGKPYVHFQGLCLLTADQYYRSYWWTHHLYQLIKWMPPSARKNDALIEKALEIFQGEIVEPLDFSKL